MLLSHYFISSLWKIRKMASSHFEFSLLEIVLEYIAYSLEDKMYPLLKILLYDYSWLLSLGYFCVLLFQLTALTPIIFNRFFKFYGILAVLFHLSTGIILSIYMSSTVLAVIFFLIIAESMREYKIERKS